MRWKDDNRWCVSRDLEGDGRSLI